MNHFTDPPKKDRPKSLSFCSDNTFGELLPISEIGQSLPKRAVHVMSAFPSLATTERTSQDVSNGPIPDAADWILFDHLVGELLNMQRHFEAERFRDLEVDHQLKLSWLHDRQIGRLGAAQELDQLRSQ